MTQNTNALARLNASLKALHEDEDGMEALQVVLILAVAAIVLAFAYKIFGGDSSNDTDTSRGTSTIADWIGERLDNLFSWK